MSQNDDPRDTCMHKIKEVRYRIAVPDKVPYLAYEWGMVTHKNVSFPCIHPKTIESESIGPQLVHTLYNCICVCWIRLHFSSPSQYPTLISYSIFFISPSILGIQLEQARRWKIIFWKLCREKPWKCWLVTSHKVHQLFAPSSSPAESDKWKASYNTKKS